MLGNNYDYQFSGKDADRLLRLSNFPKELNFSREHLKNASVNIHVDARDGSVELDFGSRITINKKAIRKSHCSLKLHWLFCILGVQ